MFDKNKATIKKSKSGHRLTFTDMGLEIINPKGEAQMRILTNGKLVAPAKSFDIPHPDGTERRRLVYGCLEGPENGVYARGKLVHGERPYEYMGVLPSHFGALVEDYSIYIGGILYDVLTKEEASFTIRIYDVRQSLGGTMLDASDVDFMVIGARKDAPLTVEPPISIFRINE